MTALSVLQITALILISFWELGVLLSPYLFHLFPAAKKEKRTGFDPIRRIAAVICAHNEGSTIGNLLTLLQQQTRPADVIYVVADNCSDQTAAIAREMGAVVLERNSAGNGGGKAGALQFLLQQPLATPPDAFVFFDADTIPDETFLEQIAASLDHAEMAAGVHSFENHSATWAEAGNSMLGHVMWYHYLEPRFRRGIFSLVIGMGYALRRSYLARLHWSPRTQTEDLALSLDSALAGAEFVLAPGARFRDKQPETWPVSWHRMRRWMTGDWQCLRFYCPMLFRQIFHGDLLKLDFLLFLLSVPLLALKALGLLLLAAAACCGKWQALALILGFDLLTTAFAVFSKPKRLCLQPFSIPALCALNLQLPWIALSVLLFPAKRWVPGRQAPCAYLKNKKQPPAAEREK